MNDTIVRLGIRFIREGIGLFIFGLVMSFGMIGHYIVGARYPTGVVFLQNISVWYACPWTLSTAVMLIGAVGMIAIGGAYATLGRLASGPVAPGNGGAALRICFWALIAIFATGYVGYFVVDKFAPGFYYVPITGPKNLWLALQLGCTALYMVGIITASSGIKRLSLAVAPATAVV